jgi:hypothetical protein
VESFRLTSPTCSIHSPESTSSSSPGVGLLITIYATGVHAWGSGFYRFFTYLNLFMFMMLTLVLADNLLLLFVGWEGVGLCILLIGVLYPPARRRGTRRRRPSSPTGLAISGT